jgi:hypothetical protein
MVALSDSYENVEGFDGYTPETSWYRVAHQKLSEYSQDEFIEIWTAPGTMLSLK